MKEHASRISQQHLSELFKDRIEAQSQAISPALNEDTQHYLTQLLVRFAQSKHFLIDTHDGPSTPVLALLYHEARTAHTTHHRHMMLRQLGDCALFMGALFSDHSAKRGINKDYFIGMGGGAYSALADDDYSRNPHVFQEMAERFPRLLQVIASACTHQLSFDAEDIFALLDRWQTTKDQQLYEQLKSIGITPQEFTKLQ